MTLDNPRSGPNSVLEYQISGIPFVTSSQVSLGEIVQINFPYATKFIVVKNYSTGSEEMNCGFTRNGILGNNFFKLTTGESFSGELRVKTLFISGAVGTTKYTVVAGLTLISSNSFPVITSSNGFGGVG